MDSTPQDSAGTQPISDDQELAQALAGVLPFDNSSTQPGVTPVEEDPTAPAVTASAFADAVSTSADDVVDAPTLTPPAAPSPAPLPDMPSTPAVSGDLTSIKSSALNSLRPLIGKVDLPAEEKFDTYLMLLRSTDDASLIEPAHAAAQGIEDEKKKAEALLEIIKEIDYLSRKDQPAA